MRRETLPQRGEPLPQRGEPLPQRDGQFARPGDPLPRRTSRTRPSGRHRSPHRLSVASDAPALVIAVPGTAAADTGRVADEIGAIASLSCPGVDVRIAYLGGESQSLAECLAGQQDGEPAAQDGVGGLTSVVVPLLLSPLPGADEAIAQAVGSVAGQALLATHLGPHPMVAEALHARLAEKGLARQLRSSGLSLSTANQGVLVLAADGEAATRDAAVAAVFLASRLSMPTTAATLSDPVSISAALDRLRQAGADHAAISPCLIGPEVSQQELQSLADRLAAPLAAPLGAHRAIGQMVAMRYGAALASLSMAG
jgi:sirohydrochlorin ferrochelatase